jgi:putative ABC transport system permease protein
MVYGPAMEIPGWNPMHVVLRSSLDPASHVPEVRAAIRSIDPKVPIYDVEDFDDLLSNSLGSRRFNLYLLACFAGLALVIACVGLSGVLAYLVSQRSRDIGLRMALGATRGAVFRLILGQGLILVVAGAALGVAGGFGAARLLGSLLYSVTPSDPLTFVGVPLLLVAVSLLACFGPAHRATRVDPLTTLRSE